MMPRSKQELEVELKKVADHIEKLHAELEGINKRMKTEKGVSASRRDAKKIEAIRKKLGLS